jgi:hypothetical protein
MKVKDLIEFLEDFDPETEVHMAYGYGDYWNSTVAPRIGNVTMGEVEYSEYHRMDKLVERDDEDEEESEVTRRRVVIIG